MKKIGLIGGIGPESTLIYYKQLVNKASHQKGETFLPPLTIESLSVFEVLGFCERGDNNGLSDYLMAGIDSLVLSGAELIALTGNTPHIVFDQLQARSPVPLISIVESASQWAQQNGVKKALLLGTTFTMQHTFFHQVFDQKTIELVVPSDNDIMMIGHKIATELEHGVINPQTRTFLLNVIHQMIEQNDIDCVILGCTELPLLFQGVSLPVTVLDTLSVHVDDLLRIAMST